MVPTPWIQCVLPWIKSSLPPLAKSVMNNLFLSNTSIPRQGKQRRAQDLTSQLNTRSPLPHPQIPLKWPETDKQTKDTHLQGQRTRGKAESSEGFPGGAGRPKEERTGPGWGVGGRQVGRGRVGRRDRAGGTWGEVSNEKTGIIGKSNDGAARAQVLRSPPHAACGQHPSPPSPQSEHRKTHSLYISEMRVFILGHIGHKRRQRGTKSYR